MDILLGFVGLLIAASLFALAYSIPRSLVRNSRQAVEQNHEYKSLLLRIYVQARHNIEELGLEESDPTAEYVKAEIESFNAKEQGRMQLP